MPGTNTIASLASAIGEPARAAMLNALMDGRALTAHELAVVASITPQTASSHLGRLTDAGLITVERQGRHRYHRLAGAEVARVLEALMLHVSNQPAERAVVRTGPRNEALRKARSCYDHLAGRLGVVITDQLIGSGYIVIEADGGIITDTGAEFFARTGILPAAGMVPKRLTRPLCRPCLDWSERRPHLAGALGAAIRTHGFTEGWLRRIDGTRAVAVTPKGTMALANVFGIRWR